MQSILLKQMRDVVDGLACYRAVVQVPLVVTAFESLRVLDAHEVPSPRPTATLSRPPRPSCLQPSLALALASTRKSRTVRSLAGVKVPSPLGGGRRHRSLPGWARPRRRHPVQPSLDRATLSGTIRDATGGVLRSHGLHHQRGDKASVTACPTRLASIGTAALTRHHRSGWRWTALTKSSQPSLTVGQQPSSTRGWMSRQRHHSGRSGHGKLVETTRVAQATTLSQVEIEGCRSTSARSWTLLSDPRCHQRHPLATPTNSRRPGCRSRPGPAQRGDDRRRRQHGAVNAVRSTLSQDAVQEFQVLPATSRPSSAGPPGIVNIVSKSGTSVHHGGGFLFVRDDALDARNAFAVRRRRAVGSALQPSAAGAPGRAARADRAFFFASVETSSP